MRALFDFYLYLNLALLMWAEEALLWPSALLGGTDENDGH